ncbi:DUF3467 domain-containing protein [Weeksellaceae bacterium TAE3-ERU29]|nr:DUF3467 domain-containing protein [Weeksellaceae bacterium TAE3-ERU29]
MSENNQEQKNFDIEINNETASGTYSNLALINHSNTEFVVDFIQMLPGMPKAQVKSRIILTPHHAKRLAGALIDNINKFEAQFGEVKEQEQGVPMNFGTKGEA